MPTALPGMAHLALVRCMHLQLVVRGIPWSYTWKELKDMFAEVAGVERADVVYGDDGRSRVGLHWFWCMTGRMVVHFRQH